MQSWNIVLLYVLRNLSVDVSPNKCTVKPVLSVRQQFNKG